DGIRDRNVTGVQTCALPIYLVERTPARQPSLPDLRRTLDRRHVMAADIERERVLDRLREQLHILERVIRPRMGRDIVIQQCVKRSEDRRVGKEGRLVRWTSQ